MEKFCVENLCWKFFLVGRQGGIIQSKYEKFWVLKKNFHECNKRLFITELLVLGRRLPFRSKPAEKFRSKLRSKPAKLRSRPTKFPSKPAESLKSLKSLKVFAWRLRLKIWPRPKRKIFYAKCVILALKRKRKRKSQSFYFRQNKKKWKAFATLTALNVIRVITSIDCAIEVQSSWTVESIGDSANATEKFTAFAWMAKKTVRIANRRFIACFSYKKFSKFS